MGHYFLPHRLHRPRTLLAGLPLHQAPILQVHERLHDLVVHGLALRRHQRQHYHVLHRRFPLAVVRASPLP